MWRDSAAPEGDPSIPPRASSLAPRPPIQDNHREHRDQNDAHDEPCDQIERYAEHARTLVNLCDKREAAPWGCSSTRFAEVKTRSYEVTS